MKIIRQRDFKDCGVCSLASIIEYYNGYVSLEKIRLDVKASNEGTSALNIIEASKKYGFDSIGIKVNSLEDSKIRLPAIAHINLKNGMQHYVVIYKITKNKVILMDPAKGKVVKTKQEFYQEWSKVLLIFYPKSKIITFKKENNLFNIFLDILFKEKKLFVTIIIMSIFMMIFTITSSYYFQIMINSITSNYYILYIKIFVIIFGMITISKLIFTYLRNNLENHLNKNIDCLLNASFIKHIFNLPLEVISSRTSGEIITRVNELANIKNLFTDIFISCILDFLLMFASVPLLLNISKNLFLALFLCLILYLIVGLITSKLIFKKAYQNIELESEFNNTLLENINMINSIKNLNITDSRLKKIEENLTNFLYDNY
ncbi:MAG: cysteine peptidase family C39 domain-containing protein, partial [Bacilli bacterium]